MKQAEDFSRELLLSRHSATRGPRGHLFAIHSQAVVQVQSQFRESAIRSSLQLTVNATIDRHHSASVIFSVVLARSSMGGKVETHDHDVQRTCCAAQATILLGMSQGGVVTDCKAEQRERRLLSGICPRSISTRCLPKTAMVQSRLSSSCVVFMFFFVTCTCSRVFLSARWCFPL